VDIGLPVQPRRWTSGKGSIPLPLIFCADVVQRFLLPLEHTSNCPCKGDASHFDLVGVEKISPDAVWYYADPCPLAAQIKDHVAFWGADIAYLT